MGGAGVKSDKKLVLVNQDSGYMTIDLANAFAEEYKQVVLITGYLVSMNLELSDNVKVSSVYKYNRKSVTTRAVSWSIASLQVFFRIITRYRKHEIFLSTNPPVLVFLVLLLRRRYSIIIWDLYPDVLVKAKLLKPGNALIRLWTRVNKKVFASAYSLVTLTDGMARGLSQYVDSERIHVIPAWSSHFDMTPHDRNSNPFIEKYNLEGKFIILYSGNLGKEHEVESLVRLAEEIKEVSDIVILIVGAGWKYNLIEDEIKTLAVHNCHLLPKQPSQLFLASLEAMNIGVVSLSEQGANVSIPSKTYNILAAGRPVLCIGNRNSDLGKLLELTKTGAVFSSNEIRGMKEFILELKSNDSIYDEMCRNAISASERFTARNAKEIVKAHMACS